MTLSKIRAIRAIRGQKIRAIRAIRGQKNHYP
jgi:hypothetical protein